MRSLVPTTLTALASLWIAGAAAAMTQGASLDGASQSMGPSIPEPSAALLYGASAAALAWSLRRSRSGS